MLQLSRSDKQAHERLDPPFQFCSVIFPSSDRRGGTYLTLLDGRSVYISIQVETKASYRTLQQGVQTESPVRLWNLQATGFGLGFDRDNARGTSQSTDQGRLENERTNGSTGLDRAGSGSLIGRSRIRRRRTTARTNLTVGLR